MSAATGVAARVAMLAVIFVLHLSFIRTAKAQQSEVDANLALVERQPAGMERSAWKEQRRDAARALGNSGDKRAVPVLIQVVETETFDAIGEIAIEALGKLGDPRAVPALRRVVADRSRDREVRALAEKALARLGAMPGDDEGDAANGGDGGDGTDGSGDDDGGSAGAGNAGGADAAASASDDAGALALRPAPGPGEAFLAHPADGIPRGPAFRPDVLAASETLTLAAGGASLQYDSIRRRPSFAGDGRAIYQRSLDRIGRAWRYGATAALATGVIDFPDGGNQSRTVSAAAGGDGELRFYSGQIYGAGLAAANLDLGYLGISRTGDEDTKATRLGGDLHLGLAGGWGRVIDVGERLRLRRIELALEHNRALGRPIGDDLADRIVSAWWALRHETGFHQRLVATVAILREAGVLLGEPDASISYQLLEILRDGQLAHRPRGTDLQLGVGESYVVRDDELTEDVAVPADEGRIETAFARARYGHQSGDGKVELIGEAYARIRILAGDEAAPWAAGAGATFRRYAYGDHMDPLGAFELSATVAASDDDLDQTDLGTSLGGSLAWLWMPNRASRFRVAADARIDGGELFLGARFEAQYGWLDASY